MMSFIFPEDSTEISAELYFLQDGATAHSPRMAMDWLKERFLGKLISIKSDFIWPSRYPDLDPCDFFLWRFMKVEVSKIHQTQVN